MTRPTNGIGAGRDQRADGERVQGGEQALNMGSKRVGLMLLVVFLLLGLQPLVFAATVPDLSDFALGLPASITVQNGSLNQTPFRLHVWARVSNPGDTDWIVYLLAKNGDNWTNERVLGVIQPGDAQNLTIDFEASYTGARRAVHDYAIVATGNAVPLGQYFQVVEDWSGYQDAASGQLHDVALIVVPTAAAVIIILLIVLAEWGYSSKARGTYTNEYTTRSLFLPRLSDLPLAEDMANLMAHPLFWAVEVAALLGMATLISMGLSGPNALAILALTGLGALVLPLVYFAAVWVYNERVERMPLRFFVGAFMWGVAAGVLALAANTVFGSGLQGMLGLDAAMMMLVTTALLAPLVEEFIKGIGVLAMSGHHEFSDALHGLLLGFSVGLGFSFVENWFYFASKTDPLHMGLMAWAGLALYRTVFNSISHACFTAALGAGIGWAKSQNWGRLVLIAFIPALAVATVLHSLFNFTAILDGFYALQTAVPSYAFNPTLVGVLLILTGISLAQAASDHNKRTKKTQMGMVGDFKKKK